MSITDYQRLQLLTKVAMLYHEHDVRQAEIAERLNISQSRVSRLLTEAQREGIITTIVRPPAGIHTELELELTERFGLQEAVVVESPVDDEASQIRSLGTAAAGFLERSLASTTDIGISSWSATLLAMVDAMTPPAMSRVSNVVQAIGGVGNGAVQVQATRLTERLAHITDAEAVYLPAPGVVASREMRDALLSDPQLATATELWDRLSMLLVGIGGIEPSPLLRHSGNTLSAEALADLAALGAVGDVCLRFFDADGNLIDSGLNECVVGIGVEQLRAVPRTVGVAGGHRKVDAIRAAALGGWIDVLITDTSTAQSII